MRKKSILPPQPLRCGIPTSTASTCRTRNELIANGRTDDEIAREIGCDALIYQDLDAMVEVVRSGNPAIQDFDTSCFDGRYITGDVTPEYLNYVEAVRNGETPPPSALSTQQLDLNLAANNG